MVGRSWLRGRLPSWPAVAVLSLLPLAFTASGFLPGRTLAPTPQLAGVSPWADPALVAASTAASSKANLLLLDPLSQMIPWSRAARDGWLFNPSQGAGAALLGNGQSAVLFPTEMASRWLSPFRAVPYSQAARLLIAAWGLFLLARRFGAREPAALLGAAIYMGSGFLQLWRLHPHSLVAAMAPWIAVAALDLLRRPAGEMKRSAVRLAACGALGVFAGHPETLLHVVIIAGVLALVLGRWRRGTTGRLRWIAVSAVLAVLWAAPVLLPMVETLHASAEWSEARDQRRAQTDVRWADSLDRLAPAVAFATWGDPRDGNWTGPENLAEVGGASLGASAVLLALAGAWRGRRRRVVWALLGVGLVSLAAGALVPLVAEPLGWIPLLRDSLLKRLSLGWCLTGAVLASLGAGGWRAAFNSSGRVVVLLIATFLTVILVTLLPGPALALELFPLVAAALILCWRPRPHFRVVALALLLAAVLLPRMAHFGRWVPLADASAFYPETLATRFVAERVQNTAWRVAGLDAALVPQSAAFFGFEDVRAYDPMTFGPFAAFSEALGTPQRGSWVKIVNPDRPALDFLGVRYLFDHPSMQHRPGVKVVYQGRDAVVYENPGALPRMFVPQEVVGLADPQAAMAAAVSLKDFAARAVVAVPPDEELPVVTPNGRGRLQALEVARGEISARVVAEEPLLLATSQPAIPGWRLTLDGQGAEPARVNGAFLGVQVPVGEHRVEFRYKPWSWTLGCWAFVLGVGFWIWTSVRGRRRWPT